MAEEVLVVGGEVLVAEIEVEVATVRVCVDVWVLVGVVEELEVALEVEGVMEADVAVFDGVELEVGVDEGVELEVGFDEGVELDTGVEVAVFEVRVGVDETDVEAFVVATEVVDFELGVEVALVLLVVVVFTMYMFKRLPPPQYSLALAAQTIEQPFCVTSVPPGANTDPALMVLPQ